MAELAEKTYSSASALMLDRESQKTTAAMLYPVTKVTLNEFRGDTVVPVRSFVVDDKGQWVEEQ